MNLALFQHVYIPVDELLLLCFASMYILVLALITIGAHSWNLLCSDIHTLYSIVSIN